MTRALHVEARLRRQHILTRDADPCQLHAVIDQNAIARLTDPAIRAPQLTHLTEAAARPNITVQVIPFTAGPYPGAGEVFTILSFPGPAERDFVYLETTIDDRMLEEPDELDRYTHRFTHLTRTAHTTSETQAVLTR